MGKYFKIAFFLLCMASFCSIAYAVDCPACGSQDLPSLVMLCPDCGASIYDYAYEKKGTDRSALIVRLFYTGDNPDKLSTYAKLYVNGTYMGNIEQVEKQKRTEEGLRGWSDGLGDKYTAFYEREFRNIPVGQLRVELEMRFTRLYGYGRSYKRVVFPYVMFNGKEKTTIEHSFSSATDFSVIDKKKKQQMEEEAKKLQKALPAVSDAKLKTATGTVKLDFGLFD